MPFLGSNRSGSPSTSRGRPGPGRVATSMAVLCITYSNRLLSLQAIDGSNVFCNGPSLTAQNQVVRK